MGGSEEEKFDRPTQKSVELMRRPILDHTKRGELVLEPFLGSGTTIAAAELTERICCGMELDPKYVGVIVQGRQTLSGKKPRWMETGAASRKSLKSGGRRQSESSAIVARSRKSRRTPGRSSGPGWPLPRAGRLVGGAAAAARAAGEEKPRLTWASASARRSRS